MKKFYTLLAAAAVAFGMSAAEAAPELYLIGPKDLTGGTADWQPNEGKALEKTGDGVFKADLSLTGMTWFSFTSKLGADASDWTTCNSNRYKPAAESLLSEGLNPMIPYVEPDASFSLPAGDFKLTINTVDMTILLEGAVEVEMGTLYLRGGMNGWLDNADEATMAQWAFSTTDENVYTIAHIDLPAGDALEGAGEWKIGNKDWSFKFVAVNPLPEEDENALRASICLLPDEVYYFSKTVDYNNGMLKAMEDATITLNIEEETIVITKSAGISGVEVAEDAPAVYYNLQGVRVANPEKGLFIQVKGGKAAKVVL